MGWLRDWLLEPAHRAQAAQRTQLEQRLQTFKVRLDQLEAQVIALQRKQEKPAETPAPVKEPKPAGKRRGARKRTG